MNVMRPSSHSHRLIVIRCIVALILLPAGVVCADVSAPETPVPDTDPAPAAPLETVLVEGTGAVVKGDLAAARDAAIADARRMAIEQVAGVKTSISTEISDGIMIRDEVLSETGGIITDTRILEEGVRDGELYRVQAEITVATDPLRAMLYRFAPKDRIVLHIRHSGYPADTSIIETTMTQTLIDAGYRVLDPDTATPAEKQEAWQEFLKGNRQLLPELGLAWGCPAVLEGSIRVSDPVDSKLGKSCRGILTLRLISTETGEILSQICSGDSITGFGKTPETAAADMIRKAAALGVESAEKSMVPFSGNRVRIRIRGLPGNTEYRALINAIQSVRFVKSVADRDPWNAFMTRFTVYSDAGASVLAQDLENIEHVSVLNITDGEIELGFESE